MTPRYPLLLTLALVALTALPVRAQPPETAPRTLSVEARATVDAAPDRAALSATLRESTPWRQSGEADTSIAERRTRLEARSRELLSMLERMEISREQLNAGSLRVLSEREALADGDGYRERLAVERPVEIELHDISRLPEVLDALFDADVDRLAGIRYDLSDRERFEDQALSRALERARGKARLMAEGLGVAPGRVLSIEETRAPSFEPRMMATARSDDADSADYAPGSISVEAGVSVSWALEDEEAPR